MDIELSFVKADNDVWGFRLTGGADYDVPFIVINVAENSITDRGGLKCDDVIVKINDTCIEKLTHDEAHNLLLATGNKLILGIKRGLTDLILPMTCDDESNEEVFHIMQCYIQDEAEFEHERQVHFEIVDPAANYKELSNGPDEISSKSQPPISAVYNIENRTKSEEKERKWSTFLQKPSNPKPVIKKTDVTPKGEPYRVIIKKQQKKTKENLEVQSVPQEQEIKNDDQNSETEENTNVEEESDIYVEDIQEPATDQNDDTFIPADLIQEDEENKEDQEDKLSDKISVGGEEPQNVEETLNEKDEILEKFLEEKLAEVQRQLEALSKLPSTLQSTIDALNKQLATIVGISAPSAIETEDKEDINSESECDLAEQIITEADSLSSNENENQDIAIDEENNEKKVEGADDLAEIEENIQESEEDLRKRQELIEAEKEAQRIEQELLEKQQKEQDMIEEFKQRRLKQKPTLPLKPVERPIILPGGRRWSQPDDACPVVRQAKMSDEKIANTIETYSEVISGNLKGINFMKYQPPPKNLDYLQRSDVYKLVHDLEPPVRGISNRSPKILAEQDYYQGG